VSNNPTGRPKIQPFVSIVIPCRNEENFIGKCLDSVIANKYPDDKMEILVVDGVSEDGTPGIIKNYQANQRCVRLFNNPKQHATAGFNVGVKNATGDLVNGEYYKKFLLEIHQEMVERLKVPLILHICGNTIDRMPYIAETGLAAFHFDSKNDPQEAMDTVNGGIKLVGNINNPVTLYSKKPEDVRKEVYRALDAGVQMISPECAIPLKTKLENLLEIPTAIEDWVAEHGVH